MQFVDAIYISQLEYELMGVDGVRSVNDVTLTQDFGTGDVLFKYSINDDGSLNTDGTEGYGYRYNFSQFFDYRVEDVNGSYTMHEAKVTNGTILPSKSLLSILLKII